METADFYPKTFQEIPEQDNPAFGKHECLMVVRESETCPHAVVLHIDPKGAELGDTVIHIAKFWRHNRALDYCDLLEI